MKPHLRPLVIALSFSLSLTVAAHGEDWPTFGHDIARSGCSEETLTVPLTQAWVHAARHAPKPAWPEPEKERPRVRFDDVYHVAVAGDTAFFGSSADDQVYALDAATGETRWTFYAEGPVRLAPTVADGRVYFGSDDGHAYCLDAATGALVWRVRGAYEDKRVLGNGRMISLWPVRTGVLVDGGTAYFGAGLFPHSGVFMCAVDAEDGSLIWRNAAAAELSAGSVSPQGYLLATDDVIIVCNGRSTPAAFSRADGSFLATFRGRSKVGGTRARIIGDWLVTGVEDKNVFDLENRGNQRPDVFYTWFPMEHVVARGGMTHVQTYDELVAMKFSALEPVGMQRAKATAKHALLDRRMKEYYTRSRSASGKEKEKLLDRARRALDEMALASKEIRDAEAGVEAWRRPSTARHALVRCANMLFLGGDGEVVAVDPVTGDTLWEADVNGRAAGLAIANGALYASTDTGRIYCFRPDGGERSAAADKHPDSAVPEVQSPGHGSPNKDAAHIVERLRKTVDAERGYCLLYGGGDGSLARELARQTGLYIIAVTDDPEKAAQARALLSEEGLYGVRAVVHVAPLDALPYSDYFADVFVFDPPLVQDSQCSFAEMCRVVKPGGGTLYMLQGFMQLITGREDLEELAQNFEAGTDTLMQAGEPAPPASEGRTPWNAVMQAAELAPPVFTRKPLAGIDEWTHLYANPANTGASGDKQVTGSLGVLWFGEPGPNDMVERHARAAAPVLRDGRFFVQGEELVMAYDAYNGTPLWQKHIPGSTRVRVDSDMSNIAVSAEGVFVAARDQCLRLDPATGETLSTFSVPPRKDGSKRRWAYVAVKGNNLFGSSAKAFRSEYGKSWAYYVDEDEGEWQDSEKLPDLLKSYEKPERPASEAFWRSGLTWQSTRDGGWPNWGSEAAPRGAVTERIMASDMVFAVDVQTGKQRWAYRGSQIAHPSIVIGESAVFLADARATDADIDEALDANERALRADKREVLPGHAVDRKDLDVRQVVALDAQTGDVRWQKPLDLTGCGGDRLGMAYKDGLIFFFGCFSNHDSKLFADNALTWRRITAVSAADGSLVWSRPLNYLRRPVIMDEIILIEPLACDLRTGELVTRPHPLTGEETPWEFARPGHSCGITTASSDMFFLRGQDLWYGDVREDRGMRPFFGVRTGCWINVLPANGLVVVPEASAGCTCLQPIRSTVVLAPTHERRDWPVFVQHGPMTPVKHMAINFGAPGDWRDDDGTVWFGYPHPRDHPPFMAYGQTFDLAMETGETGGFIYDGSDKRGTGENSWLYSSGCRDFASCELPLLGEGDEPRTYTVKLYFETRDGSETAPLDIRLQGQVVQAQATTSREPVVVTGVQVERGLTVELISASGGGVPLLCGIEALAED